MHNDTSNFTYSYHSPLYLTRTARFTGEMATRTIYTRTGTDDSGRNRRVFRQSGNTEKCTLYLKKKKNSIPRSPTYVHSNEKTYFFLLDSNCPVFIFILSKKHWLARYFLSDKLTHRDQSLKRLLKNTIPYRFPEKVFFKEIYDDYFTKGGETINKRNSKITHT